jgi:hypothetical protein
VQGVRGSQIKAEPRISACGPGARARRRFRAAGAHGRRRKERGAGALMCGTERPEREGALGLGEELRQEGPGRQRTKERERRRAG